MNSILFDNGGRRRPGDKIVRPRPRNLVESCTVAVVLAGFVNLMLLLNVARLVSSLPATTSSDPNEEANGGDDDDSGSNDCSGGY